MANENNNSGFFSKNNDLRNRILFTILILAIYRLGTYIPLPGIDPESLKTMMDSAQKGLLGMFNIFSGGAVSRMAIFALGIMPYISSAIIIQLLTGVSETFKNLIMNSHYTPILKAKSGEFKALKKLKIETHLVISKSANLAIKGETDYSIDSVKKLADFVYNPADIGARISSGSFQTDGCKDEFPRLKRWSITVWRSSPIRQAFHVLWGAESGTKWFPGTVCPVSPGGLWFRRGGPDCSD